MAEPAALDNPMDRLLRLGGELVTPVGEPRRKFDLAQMRALMRALDHPEHAFPSILIAGTNGKGSTAATIASILGSAGYTVGLYTSPHLERLHERIQIFAAGRDAAQRQIEDAPLFSYLERVEAASAHLISAGLLPGPPSFFETMTAIAMLAFSSVSDTGKPVDLAVMEVGLGGRLDATNVVEPLLSVITDISMDHMEWLGDTLTAIAREKAGILRQGGLMITLPQHPEVNQAIGEVAVSLEVEGVNAAEYLPARNAPATGIYSVLLDGEEILVDSPLRGQHQQRNVALALATVTALRNRHGYNVSKSAIERGIRATDWPGRLEQIHRAGKPLVILDVAHNPAGAWTLRAALSELYHEETSIGSRGPRVLIFGCMRDKAVDEMAAILFPTFDHLYLLELPSPRSASSGELSRAADRTGTPYSLCSDTDAALAEAGAGDPSLIVVCGSVILIGAMRPLLR